MQSIASCCLQPTRVPYTASYIPKEVNIPHTMCGEPVMQGKTLLQHCSYQAMCENSKSDCWYWMSATLARRSGHIALLDCIHSYTTWSCTVGQTTHTNTTDITLWMLAALNLPTTSLSASRNWKCGLWRLCVRKHNHTDVNIQYAAVYSTTCHKAETKINQWINQSTNQSSLQKNLGVGVKCRETDTIKYNQVRD